MKKKYKAVIVSDLHLGTKDSKTKEFLEFLEDHPTELLILNGDIVDGWALNRGSKWKKKHTKVLSKILKLARNTKVVWIRGNHDEFLHDFTGTTIGNIQIAEEYTIETTKHLSEDTYQRSRYLVMHGDSIDAFIQKYKWLSKLGAIGYDIALWTNRWYNRFRKWRNKPYKSISKGIKESVKAATNYINDFETTALKLAKQRGYKGVICGHIHSPKDKETELGHYLNSGDWVENTSAILIDQEDVIQVYGHSTTE